MKKRLMLLILLSAVFVHVGQVQAYDGGSGSSDSGGFGSSTSDSGGFGSDSSDSGGFGSDSSDSGGFGSGSSDSGGFGSSTSDSGGFGSSTSDSGGFGSSTSDSGGFGSSSSDSGSLDSNSSDSGSFGSSTSDSGSFGSSTSDSGSFGSSSSDSDGFGSSSSDSGSFGLGSSDSDSFGSGSSDSGSYGSSTSNSDSLGFSDSGSFSSSDSTSFGGYSTSDNDSLGISTSNSSFGSSDSSGNWSSIGDSDLSNGSGSWSSIGDTSSSKDNSDFSSFGDAISSGNNYSSGSWSSISDGNTSSAGLSAGNWTSTNDSVAKKSSEISDSFSDFDTGNWSRTSDTLADNASSTSKTVSDFTSGDWSRVSDSSSDKFSTSGLGLNDFTAGDWSHVSDFSDNRTSTSAAYSDLEADNWSRINDSFNNSASSTITATDDFTTGDWTRVTDAFGSQLSNKRNSLSDLTLDDWASVQDAASRTASLSPLEGEYTLSATKPTEDFVSTSPVNQWSGFNPVEGDWKQIDISEKSKTVNTPTMSEALADWAGFKQTTTSKEGLPGFALDYASSLSATGKNQLPGSFLDGDWQWVSESKPTSTLFNNPLATEDVLTNQTLPTTVDLGLSQTFSRTPEDYYQAGAMFAGPGATYHRMTSDPKALSERFQYEFNRDINNYRNAMNKSAKQHLTNDFEVKDDRRFKDLGYVGAAIDNMAASSSSRLAAIRASSNELAYLGVVGGNLALDGATAVVNNVNKFADKPGVGSTSRMLSIGLNAANGLPPTAVDMRDMAAIMAEKEKKTEPSPGYHKLKQEVYKAFQDRDTKKLSKISNEIEKQIGDYFDPLTNGIKRDFFKTPASEKEAKKAAKETTAVGGFSLYPEKFNKYVEGKKKDLDTFIENSTKKKSTDSENMKMLKNAGYAIGTFASSRGKKAIDQVTKSARAITKVADKQEVQDAALLLSTGFNYSQGIPYSPEAKMVENEALERMSNRWNSFKAYMTEFGKAWEERDAVKSANMMKDIYRTTTDYIGDFKGAAGGAKKAGKALTTPIDKIRNFGKSKTDSKQSVSKTSTPSSKASKNKKN
ncbi:hypothetical protein [Streptococcus sanguinis]|uniref:hypothetical protein n=1 Tax=Streptococcus sanguinis TaxID=1305 RepID=UPI001CBD5B9D|nr:hypothetical protein [Streptococcus sanguinis]